MLAGIGLRHQHVNVAAGELCHGVAEQLLGRLVGRHDQAFSVDDDNAVERSIEHGAKQRVAAR
jgi:hypothetical protein